MRRAGLHRLGTRADGAAAGSGLAVPSRGQQQEEGQGPGDGPDPVRGHEPPDDFEFQALGLEPAMEGDRPGEGRDPGELPESP